MTRNGNDLMIRKLASSIKNGIVTNDLFFHHGCFYTAFTVLNATQFIDLSPVTKSFIVYSFLSTEMGEIRISKLDLLEHDPDLFCFLNDSSSIQSVYELSVLNENTKRCILADILKNLISEASDSKFPVRSVSYKKSIDPYFIYILTHWFNKMPFSPTVFDDEYEYQVMTPDRYSDFIANHPILGYFSTLSITYNSEGTGYRFGYSWCSSSDLIFYIEYLINDLFSGFGLTVSDLILCHTSKDKLFNYLSAEARAQILLREASGRPDLPQKRSGIRKRKTNTGH